MAKEKEATDPELYLIRGQPTDKDIEDLLGQISPEKEGLAAWRAEVASGATELGFEQWQKLDSETGK